MSHPLGRDQLGTHEGGRRGGSFSVWKGPVEADKNDAAGIDACNRTHLLHQHQSEGKTTAQSNHAPVPHPSLSQFAALGSAVEELTHFRFEAIERAWHCPGSREGVQQGIAMQPFGGRNSNKVAVKSFRIRMEVVPHDMTNF